MEEKSIHSNIIENDLIIIISTFSKSRLFGIFLLISKTRFIHSSEKGKI